MSVNLTSASESLSRWFHIQTGYVESSLLIPPAEDRSSLQQVFQTLNARSCPKSYNFHLHTRRSDGQLEPEEVMEQAIEIGLKGLTITDHHSIQGYKQAQNWLDHWKHKYPQRVNQAPRLWTGVEINAQLLGVGVHILGYAFDPDASGLQPYLQGGTTLGTDAYSADNVITAIQQAGGLAVLAHPARYRYPVPELITEAARLGMNGIEVYYAYHHTDPWLPTAKITNQVKQLADSYGLLNTCGTDTHGRDLLLRL
ncbi:MAG TPA: PHP domain-containing protein [Planktothrix sp. UBA8407]|jgi:Predicted metal-dependent phosphoesterases (PHP family)|nr:PHP domain-containing protein [Planktothrix sp. UBA8407]HBK24349.1 PHP domain-containing protein [Planktothrix sp. UBA10369]